MLECVAECGHDSAGLALFSEPLAANLRRFSLFSYEGETDWLNLHGSIEQNYIAMGKSTRKATIPRKTAIGVFNTVESVRFGPSARRRRVYSAWPFEDNTAQGTGPKGRYSNPQPGHGRNDEGRG
jgi:hypothetical protein